MQIAIIAHDLKKELITQFCIAYCGILSKHKLCATGITAKYISEATGLEVELPRALPITRSICSCISRIPVRNPITAT